MITDKICFVYVIVLLLSSVLSIKKIFTFASTNHNLVLGVQTGRSNRESDVPSWVRRHGEFRFPFDNSR